MKNTNVSVKPTTEVEERFLEWQQTISQGSDVMTILLDGRDPCVPSSTLAAPFVLINTILEGRVQILLLLDHVPCQKGRRRSVWCISGATTVTAESVSVILKVKVFFRIAIVLGSPH